MEFVQTTGVLFMGVFAFCSIKTVCVFVKSLDAKNEEDHKAYSEKIKNWAAAGLAAGVVLLVLALWPV